MLRRTDQRLEDISVTLMDHGVLTSSLMVVDVVMVEG